MTQDVDTQLKVWKDLAISKQILMGAATDALGLDAECSTEELKEALNKAIKRAKDADIDIQQTRSQADAQVTEYKNQAQAAEKARAEAEEKVEAAEKARAQAEHALAKGKADNAEALKKARAEVTDKQNKLKAISKALADTPENVVRKLKTLKKQKMDEARARGQAESKVQSLRKEKSRLETQIEELKSALEAAVKLAAQLREIHAACTEAQAGSGSDGKSGITLPALDETSLEIVEQALADG